jgi:hypothetical protein
MPLRKSIPGTILRSRIEIWNVPTILQPFDWTSVRTLSLALTLNFDVLFHILTINLVPTHCTVTDVFVTVHKPRATVFEALSSPIAKYPQGQQGCLFISPIRRNNKAKIREESNGHFRVPKIAVVVPATCEGRTRESFEVARTSGTVAHIGSQSGSTGTVRRPNEHGTVHYQRRCATQTAGLTF